MIRIIVIAAMNLVLLYYAKKCDNTTIEALCAVFSFITVGVTIVSEVI